MSPENESAAGDTAATLENGGHRQHDTRPVSGQIAMRPVIGQGVSDWAVAYATANGWPVFPVDPKTKRPRIRTGRDHAEHASRDPAQIRRWFDGRHRDASIAMPTGAASGIVVIDADKKHDGERVLATLELIYGPLPRNVVVRTQSGGIHVYLKHPGPSVRIKSCVGGESSPWPDAGVDVRGDGGIVLLPPSSGYAIEVASPPYAPMPDGWRDALIAQPRRELAPVDVGELVYADSADVDGREALLALRRKYRSSDRNGDAERADLIDRVIERRPLAEVGSRDSAVTRTGYLIGCVLPDIGPTVAAMIAAPSLISMPATDDGEGLDHWTAKFRDSYEAGALFRREQQERERQVWLDIANRRIP